MKNIIQIIVISTLVTLGVNFLTQKTPDYRYDITNPNVSWADARALFGGELRMVMHDGEKNVTIGFAPNGLVVWADIAGAVGMAGHMPQGGRWNWRDRDSTDRSTPKIPNVK